MVEIITKKYRNNLEEEELEDVILKIKSVQTAESEKMAPKIIQNLGLNSISNFMEIWNSMKNKRRSNGIIKEDSENKNVRHNHTFT